MIGPDDVQRWAASLYDDFLRSLLSGTDFFTPPPRRERLGRVPATEDPTAFQKAVGPLWEGSKSARGFGYTILFAEHRRRSRGLQNEPIAVELPSREDFLQLLDRVGEVARFEEDARLVLVALPEVLPALLARPRLLVEKSGSWIGLIEVVAYLRKNPRPGCYVRALPVSVPTKFIESHERAIEELLSVLPEAGYRPEGNSFAERCGFLEDDGGLRGRFLCDGLRAACRFPEGVTDLELRVGEWAKLTPPADCRVIICENRANFLALPPLPRTLALWGAGGAATGHLPRLFWLRNRSVLYWGDMDPSGFAILARLRRAIPDLKSVLMEESVLRHHADLIAPAKPASGQIAWEHLLPDEAMAARSLFDPPRGIEQEKLLFRAGMAAIFAAQTGGDPVKLP